MRSTESEPKYRYSENGFTMAVEFVVVQLLFTLAGVWLDGRLGTSPALTIVLTLIGLVGNGARAFYQYRAQVEAAEEGKPWAR